MVTLPVTYKHFRLKWGPEIQPSDIRKHLKSGLFKGRISIGPVFKWSGFSWLDSPNHLKPWRFCPDFKWFLTKWQLFVQISNGWTSRFQTFKIWTICNPTSLWPFKIQTSQDFRSPLYPIGLVFIGFKCVMLSNVLFWKAFKNWTFRTFFVENVQF